MRVKVVLVQDMFFQKRFSRVLDLGHGKIVDPLHKMVSKCTSPELKGQEVEMGFHLSLIQGIDEIRCDDQFFDLFGHQWGPH